MDPKSWTSRATVDGGSTPCASDSYVPPRWVRVRHCRESSVCGGKLSIDGMIVLLPPQKLWTRCIVLIHSSHNIHTNGNHRRIQPKRRLLDMLCLCLLFLSMQGSEMFKQMTECIQKKKVIVQDIEECLPLYFWAPASEKQELSFCFRVLSLFGCQLSISHPPLNSGSFYSETALISTFDHDLLYPELLGYYDVKRQFEKEELMEEILFVFSKLIHYKYRLLFFFRQWKRRKAALRILRFILERKDHVLSRPGSLYYRKAFQHFQEMTK